MVNFDLLYYNSFPSVLQSGNGEVIARFDDMTNTFHIHANSGDAERLGLVYALSSKEEILHSRTNIGTIVSKARLQHAAGQAILDTARRYQSEQTVDTNILELGRHAQEVAYKLHRDIAPFREAIDKLLIISTIGETSQNGGVAETYYNRLANDITTVTGEATASAVRTRLKQELTNTHKLVTGDVPAIHEDGLYVDPRYFQPLVRRVPQIAAASSTVTRDPAEISLQEIRPLIEIVANITLNIPRPVAPLGDDHQYGPLSVPAVDLDPIAYNRLYDLYDVSDREVISCLSSPAKFADIQGQLAARANGWVDRSFVTTLRVLEQVFDQTNIDPLQLDDASLERVRRNAMETIYDINLRNSGTILDQGAPLFEFPVGEADDTPAKTPVGEDGTLLAKIALDIFSQQTGIAALTYDSAEGRCLINPFIMTRSLADFEDPIVPNDVETVGELWRCALVRKQCLTELVRLSKLDGEHHEGDGRKFAMELDAHRTWTRAKVAGTGDNPETIISRLVQQLKPDPHEFVEAAEKAGVSIPLSAYKTVTTDQCPACDLVQQPPVNCQWCALRETFEAALELFLRDWESVVKTTKKDK